MRESVTAIFLSKSTHKIFTIKRQNYLKAFPGYTSFPGGKVDKEDRTSPLNTNELPESMKKSPYHFIALKREIAEELNYQADLSQAYCLAQALTPEFNPYRFNVFFYIVPVENEIDFEIDEGEAIAQDSGWFSARDLVDKYESGHIMAVPPVIKIIKELELDLFQKGPLRVGLEHNEETEVPMIESISGVRQFLPLSNTFPPANRTNCFIIGDEQRFLIDPSPRDLDEYQKLKRSIDKVGFDKILITHHHSDHHEQLKLFVKDYKVEVYLSRKTKELMDLKYGVDYLKDIPLQFLGDGDSLTNSKGVAITILTVPGHDEGQLALFRDDGAWALVGDLIQTVGTVVIGGPEGDMAKYFSSLERVISLSPRFCIPSHGISIGGTHKLEQTLSHRKLREKEILGHFLRGKSREEILEIVYEGLKKPLIPYAKKTIEAHLIKLENEGKIKR